MKIKSARAVNVWKDAVKNYSYASPSCHSELLPCLNGEIRWVAVVKSAKTQNESNFLCFKEVIGGLQKW